MTDWIDIDADPVHAKRERERARALRATDWWRAQLAKGVCHYCGRKVGAENLTMDHVVPVELRTLLQGMQQREEGAHTGGDDTRETGHVTRTMRKSCAQMHIAAEGEFRV